VVFNEFVKEVSRQHQHFKYFFGVQDSRLETPSRKTQPNWKIEPLLKYALSVCKEAVIPCLHNSLDEQTEGFQGKHKDKKRHDNKNEGDGFQCDSLNTDRGHTYAFYFCNQPAPSNISQWVCLLCSQELWR